MKELGLNKWLAGGALVLLALGGTAIALREWHSGKLPAGLTVSNGRIEATEIDIATKSPGRIKEILFNEGDFVAAGDVVARMDTQVLEAQLHQAQAQVGQARAAKLTAASVVVQRENAVTTAEALVMQRQSDLAFAEKALKRSEELVEKWFVTPQKLDDDRPKVQSARAALISARSQVVEAQAAIASVKSQVAEAQSAIEAAVANADRLRADIEDGVLRSPRNGRVEYRLARPGEVLAAGGKVLTLLDLSNVYMTLFLPETVSGRVAIGSEARLVLDAVPQYVIPARVSYVAAEAQFTPKTVETKAERQKLTFRVKARIDPELLRQYQTQVKTGIPGIAYVRLDADMPWPAQLAVRLPHPVSLAR